MDLVFSLLVSASLTIGCDSRAAPPPDVGDDPWLRIIIQVDEEGRGVPTFHFLDVERAPEALIALADGEDGVEEISPDVLVLTFQARPLDRIMPLIAHLPQDRTEVRVVIRIPPELRGGDLWEFQAQLSAARIRQVRIESGIPQSTRTHLGFRAPIPTPEAP